MITFVEPVEIPEGTKLITPQDEWFNAFSKDRQRLMKLDVYHPQDDYKLMLEGLNATDAKYLVVVKWHGTSLRHQYNLFFPSIEEAWEKGLDVWKESLKDVQWQHKDKFWQHAKQHVEIFIYAA